MADLIIGAPDAERNGQAIGKSYVVFGTTSTTPVELSAVSAGIGGFVINGQDLFSGSGTSVAAAGDVNGDGLADLIVGAPNVSNGAGNNQSGRTSIIFGSRDNLFMTTQVDQMGGSGNDTLTGSSGADVMVGGDGDDLLIGKGGADVLYGGNGKDVFLINAGNITALAANVGAGGHYARIDGGGGLDTIRLAQGSGNLDLSTIANQGNSTAGSSSRIESIERIDLVFDTTANTLKLSADDVVDMAGMSLYSDTNLSDVWSFSNLAAPVGAVARHQLLVDAGPGDAVNSADTGWVNVGTASHTVNGNLITYTVWDHGTSAEVLVLNGITTGFH